MKQKYGSENRSLVPSLVDICKDENINKDARFIDAIQNVCEENETTELFKPQLTKKLAFAEVRKKRGV